MKKYKLEIIVFLSGAIGMGLELIAARVLSPYVGSSNVVWTSIIGIILVSMSLGYWLGGKKADKEASGNILSRLLLGSALFTSIIPLLETIVVKEFAGIVSNLIVAAILCAIIFFTSANAVKYFAPYHNNIHGKAYIALGEKTAHAMEVFLGISSHITPTVYDLNNAMQIIYSIPLQNARILSPGAEKRLELPVEQLNAMGAELITPAVYETNFAEYPDGYVDNFIVDNKIDTVTFCSPSAAKSFLRQFNGDKSLLDIVSIGTTTALFLDKQGIKSRYPENFTVESMVEII